MKGKTKILSLILISLVLFFASGSRQVGLVSKVGIRQMKYDSTMTEEEWIATLKVWFEPYIINTSKPEFEDCPETLEGEILIERVYDDQGNFMGWVTVSVENFYEVWKDVLNDPNIPNTKEDKLKAMLNHPERGYNDFIIRVLSDMRINVFQDLGIYNFTQHLEIDGKSYAILVQANVSMNIITFGYSPCFFAFGWTNFTYNYTLGYHTANTTIIVPKDLNTTSLELLALEKEERNAQFKLTENETHYFLQTIVHEEWRELLVKFGKPIFTLTLSSSATYVGFQVNISGQLVIRGEPISDTKIVLQYIPVGGQNWSDITAVKTDTNGRFSAAWMPTASGNFKVRAFFDFGDMLIQSYGEYYALHLAEDYMREIVTVSVHIAVTAYREEKVFSVISNSTVKALAFNSTSMELSFQVEGETGTVGYVNVTIAKTLVADASKIKVYLDGSEINYDLIERLDVWILHFTYRHSIHHVVVSLGKPSGGLTTGETILRLVWQHKELTLGALIGIITGMAVYYLKRK